MCRARQSPVLAFTLTLATACGGAAEPNGSAAPTEPTAPEPTSSGDETADGHHDQGEGHAGHGDHDARGHAAGHPGAHGHHAHHHDFSDAESYAELFDAPDRDAWQKPAEVVALLQIAPGMTVADLGAGTGYFLPHLSRAVGPDGHALGLDVEPNMVSYMARRIARDGLANAEARRVPTDSPELADASVDRVLVVDTWHHIEDRVAYARKLARALRPGGFVLVVDFTRESEHGPPPEMRLAPDAVARELSDAGLTTEVVSETLPMQYAVRATRAR